MKYQEDMILKQWAKFWDAYNASSSWTLFRTIYCRNFRKYWTSCFFGVAYIISALVFVYGDGWIVKVVGFCSTLLAFWFLFRSVDKALEKEFKKEYDLHSLTAYPFKEKRLYLRYALFLRYLAENNFTKENIQEVSLFSKIAGIPAPVFSLSQHSVVAFVLPILLGLTTNLIQMTTAWKSVSSAIFIVIFGFTLLLAILAILDVLREAKQKHVELVRFIEWAEIDIDKAKSNYHSAWINVIVPQTTLQQT